VELTHSYRLRFVNLNGLLDFFWLFGFNIGGSGHGLLHVCFFPFLQVCLCLEPNNLSALVYFVDNEIGEPVFNCALDLDSVSWAKETLNANIRLVKSLSCFYHCLIFILL
jgi:hypothetical protein